MAEVKRSKGKKQNKHDGSAGSNPREHSIKEDLSTRRSIIAPGIQCDVPGAFESTNRLFSSARRASIRSIARTGLACIPSNEHSLKFPLEGLMTAIQQATANLRWAKLLMIILPLAVPILASAQEPPYFVTYSDHMEEPGNLEFSFKSAVGTPKYANQFVGGAFEFEYGATGWWTTEFYLEGQHTMNEWTLFTGWRWENRFRPLAREHFINPVFYVEIEDINAANRSLLEITGHHSISDLTLTNAQGKMVKETALETKLILSSHARGWDISENFIAEKELEEGEPWEFGYALGASRPLALAARSKHCIFCPENFSAGAELYGGLGTTDGFGLKATSHYIGPTLGFKIPHGPRISFSPNFGLNDNSMKVLYRFNLSYEFPQVFRSERMQ